MRGKAVIEEGTTGVDRVPYGNDTGRVVCDAPLAPVERGSVYGKRGCKLPDEKQICPLMLHYMGTT